VPKKEKKCQAKKIQNLTVFKREKVPGKKNPKLDSFQDFG
jgi:hypothetical protein